MNDPVVSNCVYCGDDLTEAQVTIDHVIPLCRGGSNGFRNKAPACGACNLAKGPLTAREYLSTRDDADDLEALKRVVSAEVALLSPPPTKPGQAGRVATINARAERARQQGVNDAHVAAQRAAAATAAGRREEARQRFAEELERGRVAWAIEQDRRRDEVAAVEAKRAQAKAEGRKAGT